MLAVRRRTKHCSGHGRRGRRPSFWNRTCGPSLCGYVHGEMLEALMEFRVGALTPSSPLEQCIDGGHGSVAVCCVVKNCPPGGGSMAVDP